MGTRSDPLAAAVALQKQRDRIQALWRSADSHHLKRPQKGNVRLLCQVVSREGAGACRAARLPSLCCQVSAVLEGYWPEGAGVWAARTSHGKGKQCPALITINDPRAHGRAVELLLLSQEDAGLQLKGAATGHALQHDLTQSTIVEPTGTVGFESDDLQCRADHLIEVELLAFLREWEEGLYLDPNRLQQRVEADAAAARAAVPDFLAPQSARVLQHQQLRSSKCLAPVPEPPSVSTSSPRRKLDSKLSNKPRGTPSTRSTTPSLRSGTSKATQPHVQQTPRTEASKALPQINGSIPTVYQQLMLSDLQQKSWCQKVVPDEHLACVALPSPLNSLFLFLHPQDRPKSSSIEQIQRSDNPGMAFANVLLGNLGQQEIVKCLVGKTIMHPRFLSSRRLASLVALFWDSAEVLKLGPLEYPEQDLSMVKLFAKMTAFTYSDPNATNLSAISNFQKLESLEIHNMGPCLTSLSDCCPPNLQHLSIRNCPGIVDGKALPRIPSLQTLTVDDCNGLQNFDGVGAAAIPEAKIIICNCSQLSSIASLAIPGITLPHDVECCFNSKLFNGVCQVAANPGVKYLDLMGSDRSNIHDVLSAARTMKHRNDGQPSLIWPNSRCVQTAINFVYSSSAGYSSKLLGTSTVASRDDPKAPKMAWVGAQARTNNPTSVLSSGPSRFAGSCSPDDDSSSADILQLRKQVEAEIDDLARGAASLRLERAKELAQHALRNESTHAALVEMGSALRQMKEMGSSAAEIDKVKKDIMTMQIKQFSLDRPDDFEALTASMGTSPLQRFRRQVKKVIMLRLRTPEHLTPTEGILSLRSLGVVKDEASAFLEYCDVERKGFVVDQDLALVFQHGSPASCTEMMEFYMWIRNNFETFNDAFEALTKCSPLTARTAITFIDFEHRLTDLGWAKKNACGIFTCLDADTRSGSISFSGFCVLRFFSSVRAIRIAEQIRAFLLRRYGNLDKAFKALDANNSGKVNVDQFELALNDLKLAPGEKAEFAFRFIDRNGTSSGVFTLKDFQLLDKLNANSFLKAMRKLQDSILIKYSNFDSAFASWDDAGGKDGCLSQAEFLEALTQTLEEHEMPDMDPRLLYHFLDHSHDDIVSKEELKRLRYFSPEAAQSGVAETREMLMRRFKGRSRDVFQKLKDSLQMKDTPKAPEETEKKEKNFKERKEKKGLKVSTKSARELLQSTQEKV